MIEIDMQVSDINLSERPCSEPAQSPKAIVYSCKKCDTKFSRKDNLKRHMRRKHDEVNYEDEDVNKKSVCVHPGCTKSFYHKTKLLQHIEYDHFVSCQTENVVFKSMSEFEKWKEQEEASNYIFFSKCSGTAEGKNASYSYYACQKDGESRKHIKSSESCGERRHKSKKGAVKIGKLCPARLQVKSLSSGGVIVKYIKTHSHVIKFEDTQYHPPSKEIKLDIMGKIAQGMSVKDIQESLMKEEDENGDGLWPKRKRHFMSERSIREMKRKFKQNVNLPKEVMFQLREITGKSPEQIRDAYLASNGDIKQAVELLTGSSTLGADQQATGQANLGKDSNSKVSGQKEVIEISDDKDDDLAKAIELSLRETQGGFGSSISEEDKELSKALEASLVDNRSGNKRKRGNLWMSFIDPENPHDRERREGIPVGLKNIGNTCWFSAVIQSLFHIPKFRNLVLNCEVSEDIENLKDQPKLIFLLELQKLFSLLLHSNRKYVDPAKAIEILEDAVRGSGKENPGDQQDVSEFTHVLLDWLEDAFKVHSDSSTTRNPIAELFYGRYSVNGCYNGKEVKNEEMFGSLPLHVRGHDHLYDGLDDAMVNNQIRANDQESNSTQEHWFTHLPAVFTFELSRFIFNHQFSKVEKIHDPFHIEQTIHLARYMENNRELTREKRHLVEGARRKRRELLSKLEKYLCFGSGAKKNSIMSTLDATLEFIRKGVSDNDREMPMTISPNSSPTSSVLQQSPISLLDAAESIDGPSPKSMTSEEGNLMIDCLQRWRGEVERETETLRKGIEHIDREVKHAYDEEIFQQVPYSLHAILVHEGQANGGHYWSYIFDSAKGIWRKFNDVTVTETTWEEVQRESVGGYRNTSAYCLVYVDASRNDLFELDAMEEEMPRSIQAYFEKDNEMFTKEIEEWDAKQRRVDMAAECCRDTGDKENVPHTTNEADSSKHSANQPSLDDQLNSLYANHCAKIAIGQADNDIKRLASRLENIVVYFYDSKASSYIIYRAFLEYFVDFATNQVERVALLQRHAKWKLKKMEEDQLKNAEFLKWKHCYETYLKCNACFIAGLEAYYDKRYREGLPCFFHALDINRQLINIDCKPAFVNKYTLSYFRRKCLKFVNDEACKLFESGSIVDAEQGYNVMKEFVIPTLPSISDTDFEEDLLVAESLREKWCTYVGQADIEGRKSELLEEVIMGLVDSSMKVSVRFPSIEGPVSGLDLLKRYNSMLVCIENENQQNG